MMVRHLLGLVLVASCALMTVTGQRQTVEVGDTRYLVSADSPYSARLGWVLAYQYCRSQGMELLTQDTQEQAVLLDQYLGTNAGYNGESFWTSGNRMGSNQWLWMTTGQPYNNTFSYWNPDPPANGDNASCMAYQAGKWFPSECTDHRHYICQLTRCFYYTSSGGSRPYTAAGEGGVGGRGGKNNTNAGEFTNNLSSTSPVPPPSTSTVPGIHSSVSILTGRRHPFKTGFPGAGSTGRPAVEPILRDTIRALTRLTTLAYASAPTSTPKAGTTSQDNQNSNNNQNNSAARVTSSANASSGRPGHPRFPLFTTKEPTPLRSATRNNNRIIHFPGEVPVTTLQHDGQGERVMTVTVEPNVGSAVVDSVSTAEVENVVRSKELAQEGLVKDDETITDDERIPEDDERINEIESRPGPVLNRLSVSLEPPKTHLNIIGGNVNGMAGGSATSDAASATNKTVFPVLTNAKGVNAAQETPTEITQAIVGDAAAHSVVQAATESPDQGRGPSEPLDVPATDETTKSGTDGAGGGEDDRGGRGKKLGVRTSAEIWQLERKETSSWPTVARQG